jgi:DNA-binding transcriptional ArsR family regulator
MTYYSTKLDSIFQALADPTRRAVLAQLSSGPASVTDLSQDFDMALPSFMGHLKKLEDGGLITSKKHGRVRICALRPAALAPVRGWLEQQNDRWQGRLEDYVTTLAKDEDYGT